MAVVDRNSSAITNINATPPVANSPHLAGGAFIRKTGGTIASAADDSATSKFRFGQIPSNASVQQVLISAADAALAGVLDIGIYKSVADGGAVVDADLFGTVDLAGGPYNNADVTFESGQYTYAEADQPLWQALGLSSDPNLIYDLVGTVSTTFNGGPTSIRVIALYAQ